MQNINGEISTRRGISGTVSSTTLHAQIDVELTELTLLLKARVKYTEQLTRNNRLVVA